MTLIDVAVQSSYITAGALISLADGCGLHRRDPEAGLVYEEVDRSHHRGCKPRLRPVGFSSQVLRILHIPANEL